MSIHPTPETLVAAYELLLTTPPFRGWKLPPSDEIEFHVSRSKDTLGTFDAPNKITISAAGIGSLRLLLVIVAHEMTHLYRFRCGDRDDVAHGSAFKRSGAQVCRHHHFDPKEFGA